jgi:hypothetical protein
VAGIRVETIEEHRVKAKITVTYRFSQPDQPMPLAQPQSYSTGRVVRIPQAPQTIGDHTRKWRLGLKMLQKTSRSNSASTRPASLTGRGMGPHLILYRRQNGRPVLR